MKVLTDNKYEELVKESYNKGFQDSRASYVSEVIEKTNASVVFDFNSPDITVYSIERIPIKDKGDIEKTLICYYHNSDPKCHSNWYTHCSRVRHEELTIQFAHYLCERDAKKIKSKK